MTPGPVPDPYTALPPLSVLPAPEAGVSEGRRLLCLLISQSISGTTVVGEVGTSHRKTVGWKTVGWTSTGDASFQRNGTGTQTKTKEVQREVGLRGPVEDLRRRSGPRGNSSTWSFNGRSSSTWWGYTTSTTSIFPPPRVLPPSGTETIMGLWGGDQRSLSVQCGLASDVPTQHK